MTWSQILRILVCLSAATFSFVLSLILVPCAKKIARRFNILDIPDGKIKQHTTAIPYLGGGAVFVSFLIVSLSVVRPFEPPFLLGFFFVGCIVLLVVGLVDDIFIMRPFQKFLGQSFGVLFLLYGGFYLHGCIYPWISIIFSGLWILTIINAFNLIDVMDGLASTVTICCACGFILIAWSLNEWSVVYLCACFAGAVSGFLMYNWPQASIYLGDAGSLWLGGFLGAISLKMSMGRFSPLGYLAPFILLAIPLLELIWLIIIRTYKKIPFYKASPHHFSILLQHNGWSKQRILKIVCTLMLILIVFSYILVHAL